MGTITITVVIPNRDEAQAQAVKTKLLSLPELPPGSQVRVDYSSSV